MKKRLFPIGLISLLLIILSISTISLSISEDIPETIIPKTEIEQVDYEKEIEDLKVVYQNQEVIGKIIIPDILEEVVFQTTDNDYYLHHDAYKNKNIVGSTFLDYRNNIETSKKILIYSHSDPEGTLPFVKLTNYNHKTFLEEHPYIYLITKTGKHSYEVFSSYIETNDFDYVNLENFNGLTYQEHLEKLKKKSYVKTNVSLNNESHILILQTCSFDASIRSNTKYQLVIAKRIE